MTQKLSLLIVEDNPIVRDMLVAFASRDPSLDVREAATLADAIEAVRAMPPHVAIMGVVIPGVSSQDPGEGVRAVKAASPGTAIVGFSGEPNFEGPIRAAGAETFISKPVSLAKMLAAIRLAWSKKDTRDFTDELLAKVGPA